jgi:hypothetical protein
VELKGRLESNLGLDIVGVLGGSELLLSLVQGVDIGLVVLSVVDLFISSVQALFHNIYIVAIAMEAHLHDLTSDRRLKLTIVVSKSGEGVL